MTDTCTSYAPTVHRRCKRKVKYIFIGELRREGKCGSHAYEWLASSTSKPDWVRRMEIIKGKR